MGDTSPPEVNSWRAEATTGTVTAQTLVDAVVVGIVAPARSDGSDAQLVSLDEEPATDDVSSAVAYPLDGLGWSVTDATTASAEPVTTVAWRHGERAACSGGSSRILGGERSTPIWFLAKQPVFQPILKLASARLMRQDLEPGEYLATVTAFDLAGKTTTRATSIWVRPRDSLAEPSPIASSTGCSVDDTHSPPSVGDHSQRIQLESGQTFGLPLALDHVDTPYVRYVLDVASGGSVLHRFIGPDDVEPQPNLASATGLTSTTIEIRRSGQYLLELDAPGDAVSAGVDVRLVWSVPSVGRQPPELLDLDNAPQLVNKLQKAGYHRARLTIPANEALSITFGLSARPQLLGELPD